MVDHSNGFIMAEQTVYNRLATATGCIDGQDCFLGGEPDGCVSYWAMLTAPADAGLVPNRCYSHGEALYNITGIYGEYADAQNIVGQMLKLFADTNGLHTLSGTNVEWFANVQTPQFFNLAPGESEIQISMQCMLIYDNTQLF